MKPPSDWKTYYDNTRQIPGPLLRGAVLDFVGNKKGKALDIGAGNCGGSIFC